MRRVSRNIPLAEITLRRYEKPYDMDRRELIKKLCLSIGLLQPGDSRDIIVDVLQVLLDSKDVIKIDEIKDRVIKVRKDNNLALKGIAKSNVLRQLKRLKDLFLIEKINEGYRITENEELINIFEEKIERFYLRNILDRVKEYFKAIR